MRASAFLALLPVVALALPAAAAVADPAPPAIGDWNCHPTAEHPRPVVLIHGTAGGARDWRVLAPRLQAQGRCVFALDYGRDPRILLPLNAFAPMAQSLDAVGAFTEQVLAATGATQVDLVGHSQGGVLAMQIAQRLGPDAIHSVLAIAPTTHGTALDGLVDLSDGTGLRPVVDDVLRQGVCPACADQEVGSEAVDELNSAPITVPGIRYGILATRQDLVATPGGPGSFVDEPGVIDDLADDLWPGHVLEHGSLPRDPLVDDWVCAHLDD
ncbi:esterase/lipase family protein [Nocardia stercoris]|uniref:esterase/lipase family protein n=1 Tax=Nocardia stercoris TaxID=2483361 RepID=UPI001319B9B9|nr:alpha/beta fold hydrolase [Nocardia stercoris]